MDTAQTRTRSPLETRFADRTARVVVVGMGYVGLPLAVEVAGAGLDVVGFDISADKIATVSAGRSDIDDVPDAAVAPLVESGKLSATDDPKAIADADCVVICVPTPLSKTKDPDVSCILAAVKSVVKHLHRDMLVVLESTTYPGTTEELIRPQLEAAGLKAGVDFYLAYSPERVDPGNEKFTIKNTPRIVGGTTPACTRVARAFYELFLDRVVPVSSTQAAETVKLLENTFRAVNIGLVNEAALMCDRLGLDVWEIIEAAATKPFGFSAFYPGPGLGGHCIPIDPHYWSWKLRSLNYYARFIELAGDINARMPEYITDRIARVLNEDQRSLSGAKILILGVAYKKNISDVRESPALDVIHLLRQRGAEVRYADPYIPTLKLDDGTRLAAIAADDTALAAADCTVILTDHTAFDYTNVCAKSKMVFDSRNATKSVPPGTGRIWKL